MKQIVGYLVGLIGIVILALSFDSIRKAFPIIPVSVTGTILTAVGLVFVGIAIILFIKTSRPAQASEVPIYHGKEIVGYRRLGK